MNSWSRVRLGCVFSVAASMLIGAASVAKAQGAEIGKFEYLNSCASCHGTTGKGDGPVVKSLIKPPTDLTKLSETNSGVFPFARVYDVIDGRFELATHGTRDMPVWGEVYKRSWAQGQNGALPYLASKEVIKSIVRVRDPCPHRLHFHAARGPTLTSVRLEGCGSRGKNLWNCHAAKKGPQASTVKLLGKRGLRV